MMMHTMIHNLAEPVVKHRSEMKYHGLKKLFCAPSTQAPEHKLSG